MKLKPPILNTLKLLLLLSSTLGLLGCGNKETAVSSSIYSTSAVSRTLAPVGTLPADWEYRWLKGIPCLPPCWEGVTPGSTTVEDAIGILQKSPLVRTISLPKDYLDYHNFGLVYWRGMEWRADGSISFDIRAKIHSVDKLELLSGSVKFGEIVQSYGYPAYVLAHANSNPEGNTVGYQFRVIYPSLGFYLNAGRDSKMNINTDSVFDRLVFFNPKVDVLTNKYVTIDGIPLAKWEGFKDFVYYCQHSENAECTR